MAGNLSKFYNMLVHLIQNNKIYEENVAVKNIWEKEGNIFVDLYFYSRRKSYIFDSVFIHDMYDINTETSYQDMKDFLKVFNSKDASSIEDKSYDKNTSYNKIIDIFKSEIIVLSFMANCCGYYSILKENIIINYIMTRSTQAQSLSRNYLEIYLKSITPDYDDFYQALQKLDYRNINGIELLCQEVIKVCMADSRLHYTEKVYLAEFLQHLRDAGIKINVGL